MAETTDLTSMTIAERRQTEAGRWAYEMMQAVGLLKGAFPNWESDTELFIAIAYQAGQQAAHAPKEPPVFTADAIERFA